MYKSFAALALLATVALSGCMESGVNANCTAVGALAGGLLGAATNNNVAQSAIVGGVGGAVAADQGYCR